MAPAGPMNPGGMPPYGYPQAVQGLEGVPAPFVLPPLPHGSDGTDSGAMPVGPVATPGYVFGAPTTTAASASSAPLSEQFADVIKPSPASQAAPTGAGAGAGAGAGGEGGSDVSGGVDALAARLAALRAARG
jgi:hypothetical protein